MSDAPAIFSPDRRYRYVLRRRWLSGNGMCLFVCLNPSIADETTDDPTIRRCMGFARTWGYQMLSVVNLFAYRATNPERLRRNSDTNRSRNNRYLLLEAEQADCVVAAWGAQGHYYSKRVEEVCRLLANIPKVCLGRTQSGEPKHPLYLPKETQRQEFP